MATNAEIGRKMAQNFPNASLALMDIHTEGEEKAHQSGFCLYE